ncbi:MAG: hypothetical protein KME42_24940 [Tildeniella nuda ZEHNDER 1965/U140]|nr:hypothetical protein [Tildeniella nuda ZEHNDER 1965/U140]
MVRPKRSSATLQSAEKREAGLQSISPTLDLGNQLTLEGYSTLIQTLRSQITTYNSDLSSLDNLSRKIKDTEQQLRNLSEQMLLGVAAKYGKGSGEYGKAGGIPKGERRRPTRKKATESSDDPLQPLVIAAPTNAKIAEPINGNGNGKVLVS